MLIPECHKFLHGYRVAFGTLCLLVLEGRPVTEIAEVMEFCYSVNLPITLKQLDLTKDVESKIKSIIPVAYVPNSLVYRMPPNSSEEKMYEAILIADRIGAAYLAARA